MRAVFLLLHGLHSEEKHKGDEFMPLIINEELPAYDVLRKEHVFVVNPYRAVHRIFAHCGLPF